MIDGSFSAFCGQIDAERIKTVWGYVLSGQIACLFVFVRLLFVCLFVCLFFAVN